MVIDAQRDELCNVEKRLPITTLIKIIAMLIDVIR